MHLQYGYTYGNAAKFAMQGYMATAGIGKVAMPFIQHEYVVLWQKPRVFKCALQVLSIMAKQSDARLKSTWKAVVRQSMTGLSAHANSLEEIYSAVAQKAPERLRANCHWREKVRQTLQLHPDLFTRQSQGFWNLVA